MSKNMIVLAIFLLLRISLVQCMQETEVQFPSKSSQFLNYLVRNSWILAPYFVNKYSKNESFLKNLMIAAVNNRDKNFVRRFKKSNKVLFDKIAKSVIEEACVFSDTDFLKNLELIDLHTLLENLSNFIKPDNAPNDIKNYVKDLLGQKSVQTWNFGKFFYTGYKIIPEEDSNELSSWKKTALFFAIKQGDDDMAKEIINSENFDINANLEREQPGSALYWAAFWGRKSIVDLLIEKKAEVNSTIQYSEPIIFAPLHRFDEDQENYKEIFTLLLKSRADVNVKNDYDLTPIVVAAQSIKKLRFNRRYVMAFLLNKKASVQGVSVARIGVDGLEDLIVSISFFGISKKEQLREIIQDKEIKFAFFAIFCAVDWGHYDLAVDLAKSVSADIYPQSLLIKLSKLFKTKLEENKNHELIFLDFCLNFIETISEKQQKAFLGLLVADGLSHSSKKKFLDSLINKGIIDTISLEEFLKKKYATTTCSICLEEYQNYQVVSMLQCQHSFHFTCIQQVVGTCPICRVQIDFEKMQALMILL